MPPLLITDYLDQILGLLMLIALLSSLLCPLLGNRKSHPESRHSLRKRDGACE